MKIGIMAQASVRAKTSEELGARNEIEGEVLSTAQSVLHGIVKGGLRHPKQKVGT